MNYKVLYRKYRPTNFNELIGQDNIVKILKNSIIENKIAHAYIFTGPRGTGKTSTAKIFAKALNCPNQKNGIPCEKCDNCLNFNSSPDIIELDAASNNSVDDIRNIKDGVLIAPSFSKYKIYIIDEVHMLSASAWNAFLKTLEEPPENVIFILATTDIQKVPVTILSRCQRFDFSKIDRNLIKNHLEEICKKEKIKIKDDALDEISYLSDGCMRDALSILDQVSKISENITIDILKQNYGIVTDKDVDDIYLSILHNDIDSLCEKVNKISESGVSIKIFLDKILNNFIKKAIDMKKKSISTNAFNQLKKIIECLNDLESKIGYNTNGYLNLMLELISFINDDNNRISNREVNQIISREILQVDTKLDVNKLLKNNTNEDYYKVDDRFIEIRINNSFSNASKNEKSKVLEKWNNFLELIDKEDINELKIFTKNINPMVVSPTNILFTTNNISAKIVGNSKLYYLENKFNLTYKTNYKMIFISKNEFDEYMKNYDKNKKYKYIDDSEYVNKKNNSVNLAENLFGENNINIE